MKHAFLYIIMEAVLNTSPFPLSLTSPRYVYARMLFKGLFCITGNSIYKVVLSKILYLKNRKWPDSCHFAYNCHDSLHSRNWKKTSHEAYASLCRFELPTETTVVETLAVDGALSNVFISAPTNDTSSRAPQRYTTSTLLQGRGHMLRL